LHLTPKGDPWKNGLGCYIREYHGVYRWIYVYNIYMWRYIYVYILFIYIERERDGFFIFFSVPYHAPTALSNWTRRWGSQAFAHDLKLSWDGYIEYTTVFNGYSFYKS
jgi:hypothetical protein